MAASSYESGYTFENITNSFEKMTIELARLRKNKDKILSFLDKLVNSKKSKDFTDDE